MIQPHELRIGNLVNTEYGILSVHASMLHDISMGSMVADPIPLTPEILGKTHLHRTVIDGVNVFFNGDDIVIREKDMMLLFHDESNGALWSIDYIRYVHQIQNWYYLKTGTDLKIELP
jgi:hypothetical protein